MTIYITSLVAILLICTLAAWLIHELYVGMVTAKNEEIARLSADNLDLRNRMYATKGQPPAGVDMLKEHTEHKSKRENTQTKVRSIDPLQNMYNVIDPPQGART